METLALRLKPGQDLHQALEDAVAARQCRAAVVVSGIGSLDRARIRFAGRHETLEVDGDVELLTLAGTIATTGVHLHGALADASGGVLGGHLARGCTVRTTVEVLLALLPEWSFAREPDPDTGYGELVVRAAAAPDAAAGLLETRGGSAGIAMGDREPPGLPQSDERRADLQRAYEATSYRAVLPVGEIVIRVGAVCRALDDMLGDCDPPRWAFVSAANPGSVPCPAEENRARHGLLLQDLGAIGCRHFPGRGEPDGPGWESEESVLILGIDRDAAVLLGRSFGQNAIVCGRRGEPATLVWC